MKLIVGGRKTGKTLDLIKRSHETGKYILLPDRVSADWVYGWARELGYESMPYPISVSDLRRGSYRGNPGMGKGILIDRAEDVLNLLTGLKIDTVNIDPSSVEVRESNVACKWVPEKSREEHLIVSWGTECGYSWYKADKSPYEDGISFCPSCGRKIDIR